MTIQAFLTGTIVIRRHHQSRVRPYGFGVANERNALTCGVGASACNDRHPSRDTRHTGFDDPSMLVMRQGRRFPGRSDRHNAMYACSDLTFNEMKKGCLIHSPVTKRCNQSS